MKNQIGKITRSLCAVFLAVGLTFAAVPFATYAEEMTTEETTTEETTTEETTTEETTTEETTTEEATTEETTTEETTTEETTTEETTTEETATEETTTEETTTEETTTEETTTEETTTEETTVPSISFMGELSETYVYNVTVEFGYFSFYYDFGIWDVTTFEYRASESSNYPGANTTLGEPGWYGFDGVNNRIYIKNNSPIGEQDLLITLFFDHGADDDGVEFPVEGVEMSLYVKADDISPIAGEEDAPTWTVPNAVLYDENGNVSIENLPVHLTRLAPTLMDGREIYQIKLESGNGSVRDRTLYISLSEEPRAKESDEPFIAATMTKIGFITVGLSLLSTDGGN